MAQIGACEGLVGQAADRYKEIIVDYRVSTRVAKLLAMSMQPHVAVRMMTRPCES